MLKMEKLINYVELSRLLANNDTSVSRTRIPKKYRAKVQSLIDHLEKWEGLDDEVVGKSEQLANFCKKISKQEDCPVEFQEIVNKEFWNLIG